MVSTARPTETVLAKFAPLWSRPFDLKTAEFDINRSKGVISGYMTLYDDPVTHQPYIDTYKDVVLPGCFNRTINRLGEAMKFRGEEFLLPYLWQHDPKELMGGVKHLGEDSKGVVFENQLNLRVKRAEEALALMEEGMLRGISYGYDPIQAIPKNGLRYLKEARLHEISSVTFPAHEWAQVTDVKNISWEYDKDGILVNIPEERKTYHFINFSSLANKGQDFTSVWSSNKPDTLLEQFRVMLDSFSFALFENIHDSQLTDKAGAVDIVCSQFADVLKQWLPEFEAANANQTDMTVMRDSNQTVEPFDMLPDINMGMMSNQTLQSFKQRLEKFFSNEKSGKVLSKDTVKKLSEMLAALKLSTDDLASFVESHKPEDVEAKKFTEDLIKEIKNRIPFRSLLDLSETNPLEDTETSPMQLGNLAADMKSWLTK